MYHTLHRDCCVRYAVPPEVFITNLYSFSHNHGSGKLLYLKGNDPIGDTQIFDWTMIMGGSVGQFHHGVTLANRWVQDWKMASFQKWCRYFRKVGLMEIWNTLRILTPSYWNTRPSWHDTRNGPQLDTQNNIPRILRVWSNSHLLIVSSILKNAKNWLHAFLSDFTYHQLRWRWRSIPSLTNVAPENRPPQKEIYFPTINFQGRTVSFREFGPNITIWICIQKIRQHLDNKWVDCNSDPHTVGWWEKYDQDDWFVGWVSTLPHF